MLKKIFIDSDIFLDLFLKRDPFFNHAKEVLTLIETRKIKGFTSGFVFADLFFILSKSLNEIEALETIRKLNALMHVSDIKQSTIDKSLTSSFSDFEDAIQICSAIEMGIEFFITRKNRDFNSSALKVLSAKEFISIFKSSQIKQPDFLS